MNPEIEYPPVDPDNYPYHIGEGQVSLRSYAYTGEHIADDPTEYQFSVFLSVDDIDEIISAWCLCNGIDPKQYPSLNLGTEEE